MQTFLICFAVIVIVICCLYAIVKESSQSEKMGAVQNKYPMELVVAFPSRSDIFLVCSHGNVRLVTTGNIFNTEITSDVIIMRGVSNGSA